MNIIEIYKKYNLPENLQIHMLRVAACSNLIIDNWNGPDIDKQAIIRVSLLHDMGNMVKIQENESKDVEFLKIQEGLTEQELTILDGKRSRKNEETLKSNSYERKICAYCDQRVAPDGVVSIKERLEDAKVRYKNKPLSVWSNEEKANHLIECSLGIEKQIMEYCKLKPEDINDVSIKEYIEQLKAYDI